MSLEWKSQCESLNSESLADLLGNRIGSVQVDDFLSSDQCHALLKSLDGMKFKHYDYSFDEKDAPPALHIFDTHYLYEDKSSDEYKKSTLESRELYSRLSEESGFSVVEQLFLKLSQNWKTVVTEAKENSYSYFPCIARELNDSVLLHADYAPFAQGEWQIKHIVAELAWNIFLTTPDDGGECLVYNRPWIPRDDDKIVKDTYGYEKSIIEGSDFLRANPVKGKLVLFNSRNFHEVKQASGRRVAIGGHIGLTPEGALIAWS